MRKRADTVRGRDDVAGVSLWGMRRRGSGEELPGCLGALGIQAEGHRATGRSESRQKTLCHQPRERRLRLRQLALDYFVHQSPACHPFEAVGSLRVAHEIT